MSISKIILFLTVVALFGCSPQKEDSKPLISKDRSFKNERKNKLFVFIGEKVSTEKLLLPEGSLSPGIIAKYKILERVYGDCPGDTIEFEAFDHYGRFSFTNYKHVLLYVSEEEGKYYHEQYQVNDVYKTKDGRWAGSYADDYRHSFNDSTTVKPEKIEFVQRVAYPTFTKDDKGEIDRFCCFPEPYFKIEGDSAIAIYGNYIEDLFKLKKDGVLTARGLFGDKKPVIAVDVNMDDIKLPDPDDSKFLEVWNKFFSYLNTSNIQAIKATTLDRIVVCEKVIRSDKFFEMCYYGLFSKDIIQQLKKTEITYFSTKVDLLFAPPIVRNNIAKASGDYPCKRIELKTKTLGGQSKIFYIDFIETNTGYKFYGAGYVGSTQCCD